MTIINKAIIVIIIIIIAVEIVVLALWINQPQTQIQENNFSTEMPPYERHAKEKGFTKYFYYDGDWYGNVNGEWEVFNSKEEAKQASETGIIK